MKGFVIAGTKSGSGKTTITLGMIAALKKRGFKVSPFKVGPDFIDPGHHRKVSGKGGRNLDGWMLSKEYNISCFMSNASDSDFAVVEGVMGLFDGYDGKSENGSTAQMAKWLGLPVILIIDAKGMARSAAALLSGFEKFDPDIKFAGVIFNNTGSQRHLNYLKDAMENCVNMPCLGGINYRKEISIPERHLGLVTSEDHELSEEFIEDLAQIIENSIEIERLLDVLPEVCFAPGTIYDCCLNMPQQRQITTEVKITQRARIGVAKDCAFCFYYSDNFDLLYASGADLVFFSPLEDEVLPENLDGLYIGGGYPELFALKLSENCSLKKEIKQKSDEGMPIYAECGGFMYLCENICDKDGINYPMTGCFPYNAKMLLKLKSLGYREVTLNKDTVIGKKGMKIKGHEFHYSEILTDYHKTENVYDVISRNVNSKICEGFLINNTLGSYIHLHFGSEPYSAKEFVRSCINYGNKRISLS